MKPGRLWHPLDVEFWDDPDTLSVGESGAVLFLRLIAYAKKHQTNGYVPMSYVKRIGGRRWQAKMEPIVCQGWATLTDETAPNGCHIVASLSDICGAKWCHVVSFLAWNDSSDDIEQRRDIAREKKRKQRAASADVPRGQTDAVPVHRVELETELEKHPPLRVGEDEELPQSLDAQIGKLLASGPETPAASWRLLELLTALESSEDPERRVHLGMASAADLGRMGKVLEVARRDGPAIGLTPLRMVAVEWSSLLALVKDGHIDPPKAPAPYFQKLFGQLANRHQEAAE